MTPILTDEKRNIDSGPPSSGLSATFSRGEKETVFACISDRVDCDYQPMSVGQPSPPISIVTSPGRRWFRFRLRTLLIVCTLIALVLGWHRHRLQVRDDAIDAIVATGGKVEYEYEMLRRAAPGRMFPFKRFCYELGLVGPSSALLKGKHVDDEFFRRHMLPLPSFERIWLEDVAVTDEGIVQLGLLKGIKYVYWRSPNNVRAFGVVEEPTSIEVVDVPLTEVLFFIWDLHKIPISVDVAELGHLRGGLDFPVSAHLEGITLSEALDRMLSPSELGWTVGNGGIVIMSKGTAELRNHQAAVGRLRTALPNLKQIQIECDVQGATMLTPPLTTHSRRTTVPLIGIP